MAVARIALGWGLFGVGAAMLVLPGPGVVVMLLGLGVLARDYAWAARLRDRLEAQVRATAARVTGRGEAASVGDPDAHPEEETPGPPRLP